jgi:hypothetical protein
MGQSGYWTLEPARSVRHRSSRSGLPGISLPYHQQSDHHQVHTNRIYTSKGYQVHISIPTGIISSGDTQQQDVDLIQGCDDITVSRQEMTTRGTRISDPLQEV